MVQNFPISVAGGDCGTYLSRDRDLRKFDGIRVRDPFASA